MCNDLSQDGLCLVSQRFIRSAVAMCSKLEGEKAFVDVVSNMSDTAYFERFSELPFEINSEADRDLVPRETERET